MPIQNSLIAIGITAIIIATFGFSLWSDEGDLMQCPHPRFLAKHWCQALPPPSSTKAMACFEDRLRLPGGKTSKSHFFMGPTQYILNDNNECEAIIPQVGFLCEDRYWDRRCTHVGNACFNKHDPITGHFDLYSDILCV